MNEITHGLLEIGATDDFLPSNPFLICEPLSDPSPVHGEPSEKYARPQTALIAKMSAPTKCSTDMIHRHLSEGYYSQDGHLLMQWLTKTKDGLLKTSQPYRVDGRSLSHSKSFATQARCPGR